MANSKAPKGFTTEDYRKAVAEHGSIVKAAKALGVHRSSIQRLLVRREGKPYAEANPSRWRPGDEIIAARKAEFERVKAAGDSRRGRTVHLADGGPFLLIMYGDLHLDAPGTDLNLLERWIAPLDYRKHRHGVLLGDLLDNWAKPLAFLYGGSETPAPEGWILLDHYLEIIGEHIIGSCSGNHDDWSGYSDVLGELMSKHGITHGRHGLALALQSPDGRQITVGIRHSFPGRSMYNEVHGIKRAAMMGRRETILAAGHTHVSGEARVKHADTGTFTWCVQTAAFKTVDDYGDQLGLDDKHASPAVALVVDPRRADTDPQLVTVFMEPEAATDYLSLLRKGFDAERKRVK